MAADDRERSWLTWLVRIILPALVAAQWIGLSGEVRDVRREVESLRRELEVDQRLELARSADLDRRLVRLETIVDSFCER